MPHPTYPTQPLWSPPSPPLEPFDSFPPLPRPTEAFPPSHDSASLTRCRDHPSCYNRNSEIYESDEVADEASHAYSDGPSHPAPLPLPVDSKPKVPYPSESVEEQREACETRSLKVFGERAGERGRVRMVPP